FRSWTCHAMVAACLRSANMSAEVSRRSLVSRLRERNGEGMPHFVVCGSDALVYTLAEELASAGHRIRLTVVVPQPMRSDVPGPTRPPGGRGGAAARPGG